MSTSKKKETSKADAHLFVRRPSTELLSPLDDLQPSLEVPVPFSLATSSQLVLVGGLGMANFFGVSVLGSLLRNPAYAMAFSSLPGSLIKKVIHDTDVFFLLS